MEGKNVRRYLFLAFFLFLFALVARIFAPFLTVIIWAGLLYAFTAPLFDRFVGTHREKTLNEPMRTLIAALMAIAAVFVILVPVVFLGIAMVGQLKNLAHSIALDLQTHPEILDLSPAGPIGKFINDLTQGSFDFSGIDLRDEFSRFINVSASSLISVSGMLLKNILVIVVGLVLIMFTLFFLFLDGPELMSTLIRAIPIEREYSMMFLRTLRRTARDLVVGYVLVSIFQGVIAFTLFTSFGVKGALILGALTVVASFIPMIGTGTIWAPISIAMILGGHPSKGFALLILSAILIAGLDNVLRIFLLRNRLKIHPLLIFFAIIGGLQTFGFNGLILGPLILMSFFTGAKLYDKVTQREDGDHGKSDVEG